VGKSLSWREGNGGSGSSRGSAGEEVMTHDEITKSKATDTRKPQTADVRDNVTEEKMAEVTRANMIPTEDQRRM
jgi:hypothetical protein